MIARVPLSSPFDIPTGAMLFAVIAIGAVAFVAVVVLEAVVLRLMRWGSARRSLFDSFLVNLATSVLGLAAAYFGVLDTDDLDSALVSLGEWAISGLIEGALLLVMRRQPAPKTFLAAFAANTVSHVALLIIILVLGWW